MILTSSFLLLCRIETEDGYVEVTGFTEKASNLVRYAVKVGDRVLAVDSSFGERMWPVSTVEGVVSAVTSRLPGQQITFRFERSTANMAASSNVKAAAVNAADAPAKESTAEAAALSTSGTATDTELLERCRDVIKRYTTDQKYVNKFSLPGVVADKVVNALASAGTRVDPYTLSMIQTAYLSCRQPEKAILLFEEAVGLRADGSSGELVNAQSSARINGESNPFIGNGGRRLVPNLDALDVFTVSALLKAQAMRGDLSAVKRVLAALEGRSGETVDGMEVAWWPGTGSDGDLRPNNRCYNIVMSAAADSGGEAGLALALDIFGKLSDPVTGNIRVEGPAMTLEKDAVSYNTVIKTLTNYGRYDEAIEVFYQMKRSGIMPDKYSYTSLVKAVLAKDTIEEFLYDMRDQGVAPDTMTFNTIIRCLCEQRKMAAARRVVSMMEDSGVSPDSWTYGYLMSGLTENGNPSAALTLFETACSDSRTVGVTENVFLYTTAMTAAAKIGDYARALELLSRMKVLGIKPNLKTMTTLLGACLAAGKPDLAVDIYRRIPSPDPYAVSQGLAALAEAGRVDEALLMLADRGSVAGKLQGKKLNRVYEVMMKKTIDSGDYDIARKVVESLLAKGNIPSKAIFQTIFHGMGLLVTKGLVSRISFSDDGLVKRGELDELDLKKFKFLLFLVDSISSRNLPCEASLYSIILSYGAHLGGLPKKVATLMGAAKTAAGVYENNKKLIEEEIPGSSSVAKGWEEVFTSYDDIRSQIQSPSSLPMLRVRIASREVPRVLRAEKFVSYRKRKEI
jgi:pentatricopeptide repeat protein